MEEAHFYSYELPLLGIIGSFRVMETPSLRYTSNHSSATESTYQQSPSRSSMQFSLSPRGWACSCSFSRSGKRSWDSLAHSAGSLPNENTLCLWNSSGSLWHFCIKLYEVQAKKVMWSSAKNLTVTFAWAQHSSMQRWRYFSLQYNRVSKCQITKHILFLVMIYKF